MTAATASGPVKLTEQAPTKGTEKVATVTRQKKETTVAGAASKKAEIIGEDEVAAEDELPYDTSTATGKLAAALITGKPSNKNTDHS